jgi:cytochrome b561
MGTQIQNGAMKPITAVRLVIDLAFTVLLLCALMYRATGDAAHEWIGVSVGAVCIAHNALNWKWHKNIFKGKYNLRRGVLTAVNLLLAFAFFTLIITGMLHSRIVLAFLNLPGDMRIRQIHTTAAYWCLPLIGAHLGLNWKIILNAFRKMPRINGENKLRKIIVRAAALAVAAFGVWASFDRDMFSKLFLGFSFDYWPEERPPILFFAVNLSIMSVYACAVYYSLKSFDWLRRRNNGME